MNNNLNRKRYNVRTRAIIYSLVCTIIINGIWGSIKKKHVEVPYATQLMEELSLDDIKELIYTSNYLTEEEKDYLYNEDFLTDILPMVNESFLSRIRYQNHLTDMAVNNYGMEEHGSEYLGYYTSVNPNKLFIRNYDDGSDHKDTLAHEFIHLCQGVGGYNTITEACAEIISSEYFQDSRVDAYITQVRLVKKLMEIIGSEPIWIYNFTGDFRLIDDAIKPYLTDNEYAIFIACLSFNHGDDLNNKAKFSTLEDLIGTIYRNKYHDNIDDNEIMQVLGDNAAVLKRYYFNKRYINEENSFYFKRTIKAFDKLNYEEAMDRGVFYAYAVRYDPITYEEAMEAINNREFTVARNIDYHKNDIIIYRSSDRSFETRISAYIDGVKYEDVSLDYLASEGIIQVNYYKTNFKQLTAEEYLNHDCIEGASIFTVYSQQDIKLYDDYIEGLVPKIHYLEPVNINGMTKKLTK